MRYEGGPGKWACAGVKEKYAYIYQYKGVLDEYKVMNTKINKLLAFVTLMLIMKFLNQNSGLPSS
jgi:hypothetical protein